MEKYRLLSKKGEGTFSEVLKCQNTKDGTYWACKKMKQHYTSSEELKEIREIQALRYLANNPHILQLHEVIFERKTGTLNLIFELMDMNLYELIKSQRSYFSNEKIASYMYQMLKAIEHIHKHGYFHRDIKPENILVKGDLLKIADFGSVRRINTKHPFTEYISTRWYRAPECLLTDGYYSYPMDIWSAGCVMFEIITLHPLFPGANELDQIDKIHDILGTPDPALLEKFKSKSRNMRFNFRAKKGIGISRYMPNFPSDSVELVKILCTYDPEQRITAHRALKHNFFNIRKENKENEQPDSSEQIKPVNKQQQQNHSIPTVDLNAEMSKNANTEMFKPVLKRKKVRNPSQFGSNVSLNRQNNGAGSTSLSVLSNYSDLSMTNNFVSSSQISYQHINFASKKNFLQNPSVVLPKLSATNISGPYSQATLSASSVKNVFFKVNQTSTLPDIYHANNNYVDGRNSRKNY